VLSPEPGSVWISPDDLFDGDSKRLLSGNDKIILWEMVRSIVELPELASKLRGRWKSTDDVVAALQRPEYKILWLREIVPTFLPHKHALQLMHAAYAPHS